MEKPCEHCASRPQGIEGHRLLAMNVEKARSAVFVCQGCGARWIRVYAGSGRFEWQLVGSG